MYILAVGWGEAAAAGGGVAGARQLSCSEDDLHVLEKMQKHGLDAANQKLTADKIQATMGGVATRLETFFKDSNREIYISRYTSN